jgi:hypothetical protein
VERPLRQPELGKELARIFEGIHQHYHQGDVSYNRKKGED